MIRYALLITVLAVSTIACAEERLVLQQALRRLSGEEAFLREKYTPEIIHQLDNTSYTKKTYKNLLKRRYESINEARKIITERLRHLPPESERDSVEQKVVYLDPGHGGSDPGAAIIDPAKKDNDTTAYLITENTVNLAIARLVKRNLENCGIMVILSRDSEQTTLSLDTRSALCRAINPDIAVSIHLNSSEFAFPIFDQPDTALPELNYTRVYVWGPSERDLLYPMYWYIHERLQNSHAYEESVKLADMISRALKAELDVDFVLSSELEQKLASVKQRRTALWKEKNPSTPVAPPEEEPKIPAEIIQRNRDASRQYEESIAPYKGISGKDLHMARETLDVPAVLVEAVFLSCPDEQNRLLYEDRTECIADGITRGILNYFENNSKQ
ncbi:MAG: N-acetylmuramoyl-L-alanine amidase [Candidatus Auribacter fodinae]|jgi:N-acetylmuramoyl-L-alanine amidase|uniref:N-acetylmuramoyl-L-alanine amidase n=1 Tax=Candidatus Auribacter fodinae TaxID=2093366 RepID=A0A3A4QVT4_9BACT|nr:MAG: N-acetylmuramoyl-L-alanine amidase [Candidatus Auribacter fodinae]